MSYFIKYLLLGLGFATIVEVINMGILQGNWTGMIATIAIVYSLFISIGYLLQRRFGNSRIKLIVVYCAMGLLGLVGIEWILIGTYPTAGQSLLSLFIFQFGIFNYWATVAITPRLFLDDREPVKIIKKNFLKFYSIWFAFVYFTGLVFLADQLRFVFMQVLSAIGHIILIRYYISYLKVFPAKYDKP